uniref:Uncharacterized protein n=1 Tax=Glossina austeni TaxID=7395 RepID=A0A1A9VR40_GLOAU
MCTALGGDVLPESWEKEQPKLDRTYYSKYILRFSLRRNKVPIAGNKVLFAHEDMHLGVQSFDGIAENGDLSSGQDRINIGAVIQRNALWWWAMPFLRVSEYLHFVLIAISFLITHRYRSAKLTENISERLFAVDTDNCYADDDDNDDEHNIYGNRKMHHPETNILLSGSDNIYTHIFSMRTWFLCKLSFSK